MPEARHTLLIIDDEERAAEILVIDRASLWRKLKKAGLG